MNLLPILGVVLSGIIAFFTVRSHINKKGLKIDFITIFIVILFGLILGFYVGAVYQNHKKFNEKEGICYEQMTSILQELNEVKTLYSKKPSKSGFGETYSTTYAKSEATLLEFYRFYCRRKNIDIRSTYIDSIKSNNKANVMNAIISDMNKMKSNFYTE